MEGSADYLEALPNSWEVADLEASVSRLKLSSKNDCSSTSDLPSSSLSFDSHEPADGSASSSLVAYAHRPGCVSQDSIDSLDQFLCEALQNPRERVSVPRIEQDVEKFVRDSIRQQMEFDQLPTSYLRLAAQCVAQHYFLQSMVLVDNRLP